MGPDLQCQDCGRLSGLFGELIAERYAEYAEPDALEPPKENEWTSS